jgi:hypothetical protein
MDFPMTCFPFNLKMSETFKGKLSNALFLGLGAYCRAYFTPNWHTPYDPTGNFDDIHVSPI